MWTLKSFEMRNSCVLTEKTNSCDRSLVSLCQHWLSIKVHFCNKTLKCKSKSAVLFVSLAYIENIFVGFCLILKRVLVQWIKCRTEFSCGQIIQTFMHSEWYWNHMASVINPSLFSNTNVAFAQCKISSKQASDAVEAKRTGFFKIIKESQFEFPKFWKASRGFLTFWTLCSKQ